MTVSYSFEAQSIPDGIIACLRNASDLVKSAKLLAGTELHAPALSLAVLAMEEISKIILIDGLIFAKPGDERTQFLERGGRQHRQKLEALDMLPLLLTEFATLDPRYELEQRFRMTIALAVNSYRQDRAALAKWLGPECCLVDLDQFKQQGFYVNRTPAQNFVAPADAIDKEFAANVVQLAWRMTDSVSFVLKNNVERLRERVESWRQKVAPELLAHIRQRATAIVSEAFGSENGA